MVRKFGPFDTSQFYEVENRRLQRAFNASTGLVGPAGGQAAVTAGTGAELVIAAYPDGALIDGLYVENPTTETVTLTTNTASTNPRIDRLVMRLDMTAKTIAPFQIPGTPAASPTAPPMVRTATTFDLPLCRYTMPGSASAQNPGSIVDERQFLDATDRLTVASMGNRPTTGLVAGDRITPADRPPLTYVWDGTRWVMENLNTNVLANTPAGSYVTKVEGTAVVTTAAGGAVSVPTGWTFSAGPLWVSLAVGDSAGGVGIAQAVGAGTTGTNIGGTVYAPNGTALGAGANVRLTFTAVGYNT